MKLKAFFDRFDQFADAPDAVTKMRDIVLNLAVQGKLVNHDPNDEPACELLKHLSTEQGPRRQGDSLQPEAMPPYELPEGWAWARFADVAIIASNLVNPKDFLDFPHLAPDNVGKRNGVLFPCATVREDKVISSNHRFFPGQIVYSKIRPNLAKVVVVDFHGLCSADMYPIDALIDKFFLQRYMLSEPFLAQAVKTDTRVAMPKINQAELNAIVVPIPPLAEQKRIVAKVEELMALCDRLEAQQKGRETRHVGLARASLARFALAPTPANLTLLFHKSYTISTADLRKSICAIAVRGKLVPQDPDDEPADDLLANVARRKTEYVQGGPTKAFKGGLPIIGDELPNELPPTWKWVRSETICQAIVDCPHSTPVFIPAGVPCLDTNGFKEGRVLRHKIRYVSEEDYAKRVQRLVPRAGDIVFAREGSVGSSVIIPENMRCCLGQRVMLFRLMPGMSAQFFALTISETSSLERILLLHKGIGAKHVNVADMRNALLPLPPLAEQHRIVTKVNQLMALVDELETQLAASRATAARLLDAIVGELTA